MSNRDRGDIPTDDEDDATRPAGSIAGDDRGGIDRDDRESVPEDDRGSERGVRYHARAAAVAASRSYVVLVALAIVVGLAIAPFAWQFGAGTTETVAVIPLAGSIDGENAGDVSQRLTEARNDPSVAGVVLVVDSPGGAAPPSEELYLQVARTAEEKPVVAAVNSMAASGGYYAIAPADEIYVKPSSTVGSVGVFVQTPQQIDPLDEIIETGPDKLTGDTPRGWEQDVDRVQNAFVGAVIEHRGDDLAVDRTEIERASIYTGVESVEIGLADDVGGIQAGVQAVADDAGLDDYAVERLQYDTEVRFVSEAAHASADVPEKELVSSGYYLDRSGDPSTPVILLLPPEVIAAEEGIDDG